eukprot:CAMPEP_0116844264 /NCGR_PEP_ID=MMETSP0418-20121206/12567_1 /TAXON_ID=1158023 /ORGANISM="Astrosyne radiata, Strain 13vi08-1A" /LENGTH=180 /DNA_ID=CAMNT_0004475149 /DNA_START=43 /DNA_END=585 /DNA_ORIENTATION=+
MGCTSSTEVITDPITGEVKTKKTLGGAYPGNRPATHAPYTPPTNQFQPTAGGTSQATAHFISTGGGNALKLVQQGPPNINNHKKPEFIQVTLPPGVSSGETIHVQAPDGRLNAIQVPPGMGPGSTFTVQFQDAPTSSSSSPSYPPPPTYNNPTTTTTNNGTTPPAPPRPDDGFASGFNRY